MKKIITLFFIAISIRSFSQKLSYQLADYSVVSITMDADSNRIIVMEHITTRIMGVPFPGKFQQVDYNIPIYMNANLSMRQITDSIPFYSQQWINNTYIFKP